MRTLILIAIGLVQTIAPWGCKKSGGGTCDSCEDPGTTKGCKAGYTCELFSDGLARCASDSDQKCRAFGSFFATERDSEEPAAGADASSPCSRLCPPLSKEESDPAWMAVVDVNADRIGDLVMLDRADPRAAAVLVHLAASDGTFNSRRSYATSGPPAMVLVHDLDGDEVLDLATASPESGTVSFLRGNGDGTFEAPRAFVAGGSPVAVAVGDLDGDGIPDLIAADPQARAVAILLGLGGGEFGSPSISPAGGRPLTVRAAYLDRDGALDLAMECEGALLEGEGERRGPREIWFLLGRGDGTFGEARHCPCEGTDPHAKTITDAGRSVPAGTP